MDTKTIAERLQRVLRQLAELSEPVDPLPLVAEWADWFFELLPAADTSDPQVAYELLAAWARLRRTRDEYIAAAFGTSVPKHGFEWFSDAAKEAGLRRCEETMHERLGELATMALDVMRPTGWLREWQEWHEQAVEQGEADAHWAMTLLDDLDDAELVLAVARSAPGGGGRELAAVEQPLELARHALTESSDLFLPLERYVRAVVEASDPNRDELVGTLGKFVPLLEEVVRCERFLSGPPPPPPAHLLVGSPLWEQRVVVQRLQELVAAYQAAAEQARSRPPEGVALAAAPAGTPQVMEGVKWASPDRQYVAIVQWRDDLARLGRGLPLELRRVALAIALDSSPVAEELVTPGDPAPELVGMPVRLAEVEAYVGEQGVAYVPLELLSAALARGRRPILEAPDKTGQWKPWDPVR